MTMTWLQLRGIYNTVFIPGDIDISMQLRSGMCIRAISRHFGDIQRRELYNMVTSFELELSHAATEG